LSRCACGLLLSGNRSIIVGNTAYYYQDIYTRLRVSVYIPAEGAAFVLPPYSVHIVFRPPVSRPLSRLPDQFLRRMQCLPLPSFGKQFHHLVFILEILSHPRNFDIPEILTFPKRSIGTHRKLHPSSSFHEHDLCGH